MGPITFSGINSYSGGTTVDAASTLIGTTDSLQGGITNNGAVQFDQLVAGTYAGSMTGTGGVKITGGPVTFTGINSYSGGTTVDAASTLIGTTDSLQGGITNNGAVQFSQLVAGTYAGSMSGTGSVEITGGPVTFSGINSYTGGTTVDATSTLIGTTDSLQGGITNNGAVQFSQLVAGTYAGSMSGTGSVEITGGPVTFTGINSYAGGTTVDAASTLIGTTDSLQGGITNNGAIQFSQMVAGAYAGSMSGTGSVKITGGPITFSGINSYSGGTTVDAASTLIGTTDSLQGGITNKGTVQFDQLVAGTYAGSMTGTGGVRSPVDLSRSQESIPIQVERRLMRRAR